jgi:UPF0755 protein
MTMLRNVLIMIMLVTSVWLYCLFTPIVTKSTGVVYYLKPGTSKKILVTELSQQQVIPHPIALTLYTYLRARDHLKTGEYLFPAGTTLVSLWKQITNGTGFYYRPLTIVPGWTFTQLRHELLKAEGLNQLTATWADKGIMFALGNGDVAPEGQFFPETYYYTRGVADLVILKRAYDLMQNRFDEAWRNRAANLPYKNSNDALIVASLVEKEAYLNSERPIIAGVIVNRLRKNMLLQIDPTVIYGMGDKYIGKIHKEDLRADTPYNTYVHKGLPPTPIAMPSMASIEAAMHPDNNDYIYFVAKGNGSHQFSVTLPQHNAAVAASIAAKKPPS